MQEFTFVSIGSNNVKNLNQPFHTDMTLIETKVADRDVKPLVFIFFIQTRSLSTWVQGAFLDDDASGWQLQLGGYKKG